jgi:hypothetical protein
MSRRQLSCLVVSQTAWCHGAMVSWFAGARKTSGFALSVRLVRVRFTEEVPVCLYVCTYVCSCVYVRKYVCVNLCLFIFTWASLPKCPKDALSTERRAFNRKTRFQQKDALSTERRAFNRKTRFQQKDALSTERRAFNRLLVIQPQPSCMFANVNDVRVPGRHCMTGQKLF